jgi:PHD/YefM family antitoxin component YafN of YafNO toxin-antitoxin module
MIRDVKSSVMDTTLLRSVDVGSILKRLRETGEPIFVTLFDEIQAVVLPAERYYAIMDLLEDMEDERDEELARRVREAREAYACGEGRSLDEFIAELEGAGV